MSFVGRSRIMTRRHQGSGINAGPAIMGELILGGRR
jgi:hypothetical protein